jgi:hypothetical protein
MASSKALTHVFSNKKDFALCEDSESGFSIKYNKTNDFIEINHSVAQYLDKMYDTDKTRKKNSHTQAKFSEWFRNETRAIKNNSKNIVSYFDASVDGGDVNLEDIEEIDPEFESSDASSDESSQIDYTDDDSSETSGDEKKSKDLSVLTPPINNRPLQPSKIPKSQQKFASKIVKHLKALDKKTKVSYMVRKTGGNKNRKYFVHPIIAFKYFHEVSDEFFRAMKVFIPKFSDHLTFDNSGNFYFPSTGTPPPTKEVIPTSKEKTIADTLAKKIGGDREVCVRNGRIDILTEDEIIEVKTYNNRYNAIGQVLLYCHKHAKDLKPRIHLFDHHGEKDKDFQKVCRKVGIWVSYN